MPPFIPRKRQRSSSPDDQKAARRAPRLSSKKATLFDDLDAGISTPRTAQQSAALLKRLGRRGGADDSDSSSSELSSPSSSPEPGVDTQAKSARAKRADTAQGSSSGKQNGAGEDDEDDEEDIEFEDVATHHTSAKPTTPSTAHASTGIGDDEDTGDLDLTLTKETRISLTNPHGTKKGPSKIERRIRIITHTLHVQFLMWHNAVRNAWICDEEVHAILLSKIPPGVDQEIQRFRIDSGLEAPPPPPKGKRSKGKGKQGNEKVAEVRQRDWGATAQRRAEAGVSDPLGRLLRMLAAYWRKRFRVTAPGLRKRGYMSLERLDEEVKSFRHDPHDPDRHGERIRNLDEFRQLASRAEGSRDVGAQLFTALLRAIGLEARMVASLQPVGFSWTKKEEAAERKKKFLSEARAQSVSDDESGTPIKSSSSKTSRGGRAGAVNGSNSTTKGDSDVIELSDDSSDDAILMPPPMPKKYDHDLLYPHYWSEVLSPVTNRYIPVDGVVTNCLGDTADNLAMFEPRNPKAEKAKQVIAYVVGFSPDGTAKDVTVRYLKHHAFPGKTKGMRIPVEKVPVYNSKGKIKRHEEFDWFKQVMSGYVRAYYPRKDQKGPSQVRTDADVLEEKTDLKVAQPERKEVKEGEETLQYYKTSTEYVLERHLRREEALLPQAKHVKFFTVKGKGGSTTEEKVFLRKDVVPCKSTETWHKEGRAPKPDETALKLVPYRAATTNRRRELAEAELATGEKLLQGLFSWDQTDWIIPPPIRDGIIPKNSYGNMDVFVPSMIPQGAVHIPRRGVKAICRKLGLDFAEAVTGFEFGHRMAVPVIHGVVIAAENEEMVLEQWEVDEAERVRREDEKRRKAALAAWRKFLMGLRIIERVRDEYGDEIDDTVDAVNPWTNQNAIARKEKQIADAAQHHASRHHDEDMAGGFLPDGHDDEGGGFFPTRHEDDDDDGALVVDHGDAESTPEATNGDSRDMESDIVSDLEPEAPKRAALSSTSTSLPPKQATRRAPGAKRQATATAKAKAKAKRRGTLDDMADTVDDSVESSLSDLDLASDSGDEDSDAHDDAAPRPSNRPRSARVVPEEHPERVMPRRKAALKSHYFEHSDDE